MGGPGAAKKTAVQAQRSGAGIDHEAKHRGGENAAKNMGPTNAKKLDEDTGNYTHAKITHEFKVALMQARTAKKMSQADLAKLINEKQSVINEYESGKTVPVGAMIAKLNRALGCRLPKVEKPKKEAA